MVNCEMHKPNIRNLRDTSLLHLLRVDLGLAHKFSEKYPRVFYANYEYVLQYLIYLILTIHCFRMSDGVWLPACSIIINSLEGPKRAMKYFPSEFACGFCRTFRRVTNWISCVPNTPYHWCQSNLGWCRLLPRTYIRSNSESFQQ